MAQLVDAPGPALTTEGTARRTGEGSFLAGAADASALSPISPFFPFQPNEPLKSSRAGIRYFLYHEPAVGVRSGTRSLRTQAAGCSCRARG
jgi:hypothetical protein